jgi:excinuclease ABC subunit A
MIQHDRIEVRGASEHNLKSVDLTIERGAITVITGVSGSGKSSLAFDTILAEAQRRFFYTLSHYSRQFLDLSSRPAVKQLSGLSPAIALAQNETQPSRRATVGSLTDVSELLGVMFARFGAQRCPEHGLPTEAQTAEAIAERLLATEGGKTVAITAPIAEAKKGNFKTQLTAYAEKGFLRAYVDGAVVALSPLPQLKREEKHTIKLIVDYVKLKDGAKARLLRSIATALGEGGGVGEWFPAGAEGRLDVEGGGAFATTGGCPVCGFSWPRLDSRHFSANSLGKCEDCGGYGILADEVDEELDEAAAEADDEGGDGAAFSPELPPCPACRGTGLASRLQGLSLGGKTPHDVQLMAVDELVALLAGLREGPSSHNPAFVRVADEVAAALTRLSSVGLGYLHLARRVRSLSSGEAQRLKLANILGGSLRGVLYVLDEPSQGLHPTELERLWQALERLKAAGNTVLIVDHDEALMRRADWIVDLGPGGGARGGKLMAKFRPHEAKSFAGTSATARHLAMGARARAAAAVATVPAAASAPAKGGAIVIEGARLHNLKIERVAFPLNALSVVAGVSGAGKTSLAIGTLYGNLYERMDDEKSKPRHCKALTGEGAITSVYLVDRKKLAKSSVSMPASYLDVFGELRDLYASMPEAQVAGLTARDFSLSVEGGRCPECKGRGELALKMRFLADARVKCPVCKGHRYRSRALGVKYLGYSIAQALELTLDEVAEHFKTHKKITQRLAPALALGLGYLKLGQPSSSLSGGEAQRLKLVPLLARKHGAGSVVVLDEPTTGLHFEDVGRLIAVLRSLVEVGATVVAIEHNEDVIAAADWVVELGPGSAAAGGRLVYAGPPKLAAKS